MVILDVGLVVRALGEDETGDEVAGDLRGLVEGEEHAVEETKGSVSLNLPTHRPEGIIGGNCRKYHFCRETNHVFVATKHVFCRDESMFVGIFFFFFFFVVATKRAGRNKSFVSTSILLS